MRPTSGSDTVCNLANTSRCVKGTWLLEVLRSEDSRDGAVLPGLLGQDLLDPAYEIHQWLS